MSLNKSSYRKTPSAILRGVSDKVANWNKAEQLPGARVECHPDMKTIYMRMCVVLHTSSNLHM